jgi:hypothetical protein
LDGLKERRDEFDYVGFELHAKNMAESAPACENIGHIGVILVVVVKSDEDVECALEEGLKDPSIGFYRYNTDKIQSSASKSVVTRFFVFFILEKFNKEAKTWFDVRLDVDCYDLNHLGQKTDGAFLDEGNTFAHELEHSADHGFIGWSEHFESKA